MIKILIADDDLENTKYIINNIVGKIDELRVECITIDGIETIEAISKKHFDIVLLDLQMPKMTGLEVIEKIKTLNIVESPKIIILSGNLSLVKYASISNIVCDIILKTESIDSIYEKILRTVNQIIYDRNNKKLLKK